MLSNQNHTQLKSQVALACLEFFPEAKAIVIWGGAATPDFAPTRSDVDVIIEVDDDIKQEFLIADRLKTLVQKTKFCHLDPFVYLTGELSVDPLEFVAPFGFYKANAFIPHMIQNQNEVIYGESRLLSRLPMTSIRSVLTAHLPQVMLSLRRLRMDAQVESSSSEIMTKHQPALFVALRTLYSFDHGKIGSKLDSLTYLTQRFPDYQAIAQVLMHYLREGTQRGWEQVAPALLLAFANEMAESLDAAKHRETRH